ncbi:MAG: hypothetical protein COU31_04890 [Candidatus Magasanikbacteria bacterium CG10_big_fil_rev_8_21_14_0_10_40_10]|uniref:Uncharacterized protein n=1 Tax=Candidatus Magasanikbacteria bacterium CG10_big_fil_rev_8_21_14_0_10_40_10 TaxID=1974648 RepID=A0A2M6W2Y5_9BACT|nr:MAG: hypothetical protein COU31_04890 [Candidatus Magasanikbacteria bacterium CG10_big_fil_rev_8_21_14_0_10_40_10]
MPLRTRIFIVFSVIVLAVLVISLVLIIGPKKILQGGKTDTDQTATDSPAGSDIIYVVDSNGNTVAVTPAQYTVAPATTEETDKNSAKQTARIFIERYGSYSTDNKGQNIVEIKSLTTDALYSKLSVNISSTTGAVFKGVTTKVITNNLSYYSAGSAQADMYVMRDQNDNGAKTSLQQAVSVEMVKLNSKWLVSDFTWK